LKNLGPTLAVAYLVAVLALTFAAFDLRGDIRPVWTLALMAATLPFSAVAWLGLYSLVHGAGLTCFAFYFLICAGVNVAIVAHLVGRRRRAPR
jgi:uncharacterized membrane protein YfbV (UPF0208 family)